ncbi:MAG TPA: DUF459 domain-containing protein [Acidimicrobiia bacterium]
MTIDDSMNTPEPPTPEPESTDITRTRPPRVRRTSRSTMPAGHAVLAMLVAFALGSLFNADSMLQTAQTQKLGSQRHSLGVAIMRPIHAISEFLRLDRPRHAIDRAIGHGPPPSPKKNRSSDPFAVPSTTTTRPNGPTTTAEDSTRFQPLVVSRQHPATIFVAGDSLSFEFGTSLYRIAAGRHTYRAAGAGTVDFKVSSGLARPDYFNWPAELAHQVGALNPQIVVLMLGSNDNQPLLAPDGHTYAFATDGWKREYHRRVGAVMDQLIARNRWVAYVGVPILATRNEQWPIINTVIREEAAKRARAVYIDSFTLFQDPNGNYTQYLPNAEGQLVQVRTADGIHFQRAGGDLLARRTLDVMEHTIVRISRR